MGKSLKTSQRTIAAVSVASLALLNVGIMAPAAHAEGEPAVSDSALPEMPNTVTLKIHKHVPDANTKDSKPNGTVPETLPSGAAIGGVTFNAYKVTNIDLTTNQGWKDANAFTEAWNGASKEVRDNAIKAGNFNGMAINNAEQAKKSVTTSDDGLASFSVSGSERGLYVVQETITGEKVKVGGVDKNKNSVNKAAPFVVALPMTNQKKTSQWLSEVNVYPKNTVSEVTKEVEDIYSPGSGNANEKSDITYMIKGGIPQHVKIDAFDTYKMVDPLDSRLEYRGSTLKVGDTVLDESLYEIKTIDVSTLDPKHTNPASDDGDTIGTYVTVVFNKDGRQALLDSGAEQVQWDLKARVKDTVAEGSAASIENKAFVIPDNEGGSKWDGSTPPNKPEIPGNPSEKVVSKYGKITINKVAKGSNKTLGGATFELYTCSLDENNKPVFDKTKNRVSVDGKDEWTTAEETKAATDENPENTIAGQVDIDGLQLNDFANHKHGKDLEAAREAARKAAKNFTNTHYCLVETKAPAGYELLPEPIAFQLTEAGSNEVITKTIENVSNNGGFDLPLTGGKGIFGLIALGALLVLGSIGYIFFASRRQES